MKPIYKITLLLLTLSLSNLGMAQVAIGNRDVSGTIVPNSTPEGMLDLQNADNYGFVFPKAALTSSIVTAPVTNPNDVDPTNLEVGTVVFNTATTTSGANDVSPGIYAWDGSQWNPQYLREDSAIFEQTLLDDRTVTGDLTYNTGTSDWAYISGFGPSLADPTGSIPSFTAKYTGTYRIKTSFNFGGGRIILPDVSSTPSSVINIATMEGLFRFTFDGASEIIYTHSYSMYNDGVYYDQFKHDTALVQYVTLTAGQTYNFSLEVDIFVANFFENGGDSGDGRGHVGIGTPCTVEFTFIN